MQSTTDSPATIKDDPSSDEPDIVINANYELFIIALLILQLVNSILWVLVSDPEQLKVLRLVGAGIGILLLLDAFRRWLKAPSRKRFMGEFHGWLTFVGSLPIPFFSLLRLLWYALATRKMQKNDLGLVRRVVVEQRARSTLFVVLLLAIVVVEVASLLILRAEDGVRDANILTASDAIWWSLVTVATVGYGDKYPVTDQGRIVGVGLMIVGVGLFGVFTSFLAQWFVTPKKRLPKSKSLSSSDQDLNDLQASLEEIQRKLDEQSVTHQASTVSLHERLEAIEKRLG